MFEKVKADIRLMREELNNIERSKQPKERSLAQLRSSLEAMQSTKEGIKLFTHWANGSSAKQIDKHIIFLPDVVNEITLLNRLVCYFSK